MAMQASYKHADAGTARNMWGNPANHDENHEDRQLFEQQNVLLTSIAETVEFREKNTDGHIRRVCCYLKLLAHQLLVEGIYQDEIASWDLDIVILSAQLHDLGKIAVPDQVLNKPGKLSGEEFDIVKSHAAMGVEIIRKVEEKTQSNALLHHARVIAGTHHEKWNGSGYPLGLVGCRIPLEGRLLALADVYDALVTERPYKQAFSFERANKIINETKGLHFDPILVDVFNVLSGRFAQVALAYCANVPTLRRV
jgi:putative two-component system response regulator